MKVLYGVVVLQSVFSLAVLDEVEDKGAKAVVVEADYTEPTSKAAANDKTQTRLFTSDPTLNSAIAGVGIGVVGSLIVGALLDAKKNKCNPRYRRDTPSARFLPGLGGKKCPPVGYPAPYPQSSYPQTGYQPGYPHPQPVHGYPTPYGQPVPTPAYHHPVPNHGYQQPSPVYQNPSPVYQNPSPAYHKPNTGYQNTGYSQPSPVYHQPAPSYPTQTPSYRPPSNSNYRPQSSGYKPSSNSGYNGNFSPSSYPPSPTYQNSGYNSGYRAPGRSLKVGSSTAGAASSGGPASFSAGIRALPGADKKDASSVNFSG